MAHASARFDMDALRALRRRRQTYFALNNSPAATLSLPADPRPLETFKTVLDSLAQTYDLILADESGEVDGEIYIVFSGPDSASRMKQDQLESVLPAFPNLQYKVEAAQPPALWPPHRRIDVLRPTHRLFFRDELNPRSNSFAPDDWLASDEYLLSAWHDFVLFTCDAENGYFCEPLPVPPAPSPSSMEVDLHIPSVPSSLPLKEPADRAKTMWINQTNRPTEQWGFHAPDKPYSYPDDEVIKWQQIISRYRCIVRVSNLPSSSASAAIAAELTVGRRRPSARVCDTPLFDRHWMYLQYESWEQAEEASERKISFDGEELEIRMWCPFGRQDASGATSTVRFEPNRSAYPFSLRATPYDAEQLAKRIFAATNLKATAYLLRGDAVVFLFNQPEDGAKVVEMTKEQGLQGAALNFKPLFDNSTLCFAMFQEYK